MLIDNEADVDHVDPKTGMTPIILCAAANNLNMVERLIDEGAFLTKQDKGGFTALHHAAYEAHVSMVYLLLDNDHERGGARDMKDRSGNLPVDWSLRQRLKEDCKNDKEFLEEMDNIDSRWDEWVPQNNIESALRDRINEMS